MHCNIPGAKALGTFTPCGFCPAGEDDLQDGRTRLIERRRLIGTAALPRRKAQPAQDGRWGCVGESFGKEGLACWVFQACEIYGLWFKAGGGEGVCQGIYSGSVTGGHVSAIEKDWDDGAGECLAAVSPPSP